MKKIYVLLLFILVFSLSGCGLFNPPETQMSKLKTLNVEEEIEDYDFESHDISLYEAEGHEGVLYVNVESFLEILGDSIIEYQTTTFGSMVVSMSLEGYSFFLDVDVDYNELRLSDFSFLDYMNNYSNKDGYEVQGDVTDYAEGNNKQVIQLSNYGYHLTFFDGGYYIPYSVANLFLTGSGVKTYIKGDTMYVSDDLSNVEDNFSYDSELMSEEEILEESKNFVTLLFDYFYGLQTANNVTRYKDEFEDYGLYDTETLDEFTRLFTQYIYDLDDLHTGIMTFGYEEDAVDVETLDIGPRITAFYEDYYLPFCYDREEDFTLYEDTTFYILQVNSFGELDNSNMVDLIKSIDKDKPVYIDLSCNTGGYLSSAIEFLTYLTDEDVTFNMANDQTKENIEQLIYTDGNPKLDNPIFIYQSNITFSAGNLISSFVKDQDIAILFGEKSGGGACAVNFMVLPNNMILTISSNNYMKNLDKISIEHGINADVETSENDIFSAMEDLKLYYRDMFDVNVNYEVKTNGEVSLMLESSLPSSASITVQAYDTLSDDYFTGVYNGPNVSFKLNDSSYEYTIIVTTMIDGEDVTFPIY